MHPFVCCLNFKYAFGAAELIKEQLKLRLTAEQHPAVAGARSCCCCCCCDYMATHHCAMAALRFSSTFCIVFIEIPLNGQWLPADQYD